MGLIKQLRTSIRELCEELRYRRESVKVCFAYHLSTEGLPIEGGLDRIVEVTNAVKQARDTVQSRFDNLKIQYGCPTGLAHVKHSFTIYGPNESTLESAFDKFIQIAGTPDFIHENFELAERILRGYDKKLQRRHKGGLVGKWVVSRS